MPSASSKPRALSVQVTPGYNSEAMLSREQRKTGKYPRGFELPACMPTGTVSEQVANRSGTLKRPFSLRCLQALPPSLCRTTSHWNSQLVELCKILFLIGSFPRSRKLDIGIPVVVDRLTVGSASGEQWRQLRPATTAQRPCPPHRILDVVGCCERVNLGAC